MPELVVETVREFLLALQGKEIDLDTLRRELHLDPNGKSWDGLRTMMHRLAEQKIVKPSGKRGGVYKVITQVKPVQVFGVIRERRPPFDLIFPKDFDTGREMMFAEDAVIREGDLILISGMSNFGKTTLCLNFCGENIDKYPVLMGNEYTTIDQEPSPRLLTRLDGMDWVEWVDVDGNDKFTLLPIWDDYAEHIVKDKINIIDWINLQGEYYMISPVMEAIKRALGRGIGIIALQKNEGFTAGRGGAPTKDFADCELLIDKYGDSEILLTIGKVKEYKNRLLGKTYAYGISGGVKIINFREVVKCHVCYGKGWAKAGNSTKPCDTCGKTGYINKHIQKDEDLI